MMQSYLTKNRGNISLALSLTIYGIGFIIEKQQQNEENISLDIRCYIFLVIYLLASFTLIGFKLDELNKAPIFNVLVSNILIASYLESLIANGKPYHLQQQVGLLPLVQLLNRLRKNIKGSPKLTLIQYLYPQLRLVIQFLTGFQFWFLSYAIILFLYALRSVKTVEITSFVRHSNKDLHLNVMTLSPSTPPKIITPSSDDPSYIYHGILRNSQRKILKSSNHSQLELDQTVNSKRHLFSQKIVGVNEKAREEDHQLEVLMSMSDSNGNYFLENLFNNFHDGIIMIDSHEKVIYINNKTYKLFNLDSTDQIIEQLKLLLLRCKIILSKVTIQVKRTKK